MTPHPLLPGAESARKVGKAATTFAAPVQASGDDFSLVPSGPPPADAQPGLFEEVPRTKADKLRDVEEGAESLRILLDRTLGPKRGPQIPGHYGNGTAKNNSSGAK